MTQKDLRRKSSERLESSTENELGMRYAIWSLKLVDFHDFAFFKQSL